MTEYTVSWLMMGIGTLQVLLLVVALTTLDDGGLPKTRFRPRRGEKLFGVLGVIMSVLDDALARFTTFVKDVVDQLKNARNTNDTQTGKLAELQSALDVALSDDAEDKATISRLQSEIGSLQESVAAQINAAVDALENAPAPADLVVAEPVAEPVVEESPVEVPVTEDTPAPVEEAGDAPVE